LVESVKKELKNPSIPFSGRYDFQKDVERQDAEPLSEDLLQAKDVAERCPRYLFRAHSSKSGSDPRLNTLQAIQTHADLHGPFRNSIRDYTQRELFICAYHHLTSAEGLSPFSSWSQSLSFVLGWAHKKFPTEPDVGISIIGTKKLSARNVCLYIPELRNIFPEQQGLYPYKCEFFCFGTVSGDAHKAVRYKDLLDANLVQYLHLRQGDPEFEPIIDSAVTVSAAFGPVLRVPVLLYLLGLEREEVKDKLEDRIVAWPQLYGPDGLLMGWVHDHTIMKPGFALGTGFKETGPAIGLLRTITVLVHNRVTGNGSKNDDDSTIEQFYASAAQQTEPDKAAQKRQAKLDKELFIDMKS
jgi:hypothetical protein